MITEDYVSFEIAKLLKEKGFDGECSCYYFFKDEAQFEESLTHWNWNNGYTFRYSAPTLQMVMKWLREVHHLFVFISTWRKINDVQDQYYYEIRELGSKDYDTLFSNVVGSYEQTCESAIKYCLENLI